MTQDPIGLAGGVNLYAYAGNNPVMFSDPFGLSPDVEYADQQTKQDIDEVRKKSKTFDNSMRDLENNHSIVVRIGRGNTANCGGSGGCAEQMGKNATSQSVYKVTVNDGAISADDKLLRLTAGTLANIFTTLGHEVYGHVVPWMNGFDCADGPPGTPAAQSCSVRRENVIRREMGYTLRRQY